MKHVDCVVLYCHLATADQPCLSEGPRIRRWLAPFVWRLHPAQHHALPSSKHAMSLLPPLPPFQVIIFHPSHIPPDTIMERLTCLTSSHRVLSLSKAAVAGLLLPVAFGIDVLIIPGPQVGGLYLVHTAPSTGHLAINYLVCSRHLSNRCRTPKDLIQCTQSNST